MEIGVSGKSPEYPDLGAVARFVLLPAFIAFAIYLGHAAFVGSWIIDDAGISFAYARNLAEGHGLVAQPGEQPVEGFTNLLWVLVLAAAMKLGQFDPTTTPKLLAAFCVVLSFILTGYRFSASGSRPAWLTTSALSITAATTGFAIWCASGLENALYALLVSVLAVTVPAAGGSERARILGATAAGITVFLLFCTRPDGVLYGWIPAFLLGAKNGARRGRGPLVAYVAGFVVPWILLTLFRVAYFQDVLPNTFYAKKGEGAKIFAWLLEHLPLLAVGLIVAAAGVLGVTAIALGSHALGSRLGRRAPPGLFARHVLALCFATSLLVHQALPGDWMPEFRFATPAFLMGPAAVVAILWDASTTWRAGRPFVLVAALVSLAVAAGYSIHHTRAFARSPTIPFDDVRRLNLKIARVSETLGPRVAVLTPDIGGALWEDRFRVIDLVGLTDRALGRTIPRDRRSLTDHILMDRRPEGVWLHSFWMDLTGFADDPAFAAAYAPVWEERSSPRSPPTAGFYLRRDLAEVGADGLARPQKSR